MAVMVVSRSPNWSRRSCLFSHGVFVFVISWSRQGCSGSIRVGCIPDLMGLERLMCEVEFGRCVFEEGSRRRLMCSPIPRPTRNQIGNLEVSLRSNLLTSAQRRKCQAAITRQYAPARTAMTALPIPAYSRRCCSMVTRPCF